MKKRKIIVFFILLFMSSGICLKAQKGSSDKPIAFGLKAGGVFSGFTNHQEIFTSLRGGVSAGLFFEFKPISLLGISVEANYLQEGAFHANPFLIYPASSVNYTSSIYKTLSDVRLHTVHVPVLVNLRAPNISGDIVPKLMLGYFYDYYFNATSQDMYMIGGSSDVPLSERGNENISGNLKTWNMGPIAGVGVDFNGDKLTYMIEARYKVGLKDINNLGGLNSINNQYDFSVNSFTITLGVGF